ncbi:MAG: hypothetical protein ABI665_00115 [Vicinamibacterales bacterium]
MIRGAVALVAVLVARFILAVLIGWVANRRNASWTHVACVANTFILASVVLMIDEFRDDGLTLYSAFYAILMVWLAYAAAKGGNIGYLAIKANQTSRAEQKQP